MPHVKPKIDNSVVEKIKSLPASVFAKPIVCSSGGGGYYACIDYGPHDQVSFPVPSIYANTANAALEMLKEWLISDCLADGRHGKKKYQPHFCNYVLRYKLVPYWEEKLNVG